MDAIDRTHYLAPSAMAVSRRTIAQTIVPGGMLAALLIRTAHLNARAQATPAADSDAADELRPRRFVLRGATMEIQFAWSASGAARLDLRDANRTLSVAGDELDLTRHESLGLVVSAFVDAVPDGYVQYLSLLVPAVNRDEDRPDVPIQTLAILTNHLTSIGGPALVQGALQTYDVITLDGVAEFAPA